MNNVEQILGSVTIHAAGGGGINIANSLNDGITALGDGFATTSMYALDTSMSNLREDNLKNFTKIDTHGHSSESIDGSGGERATHSKEIVSAVGKYLDKQNLIKRVTGEYHIVVFSASGGTGSVVGPVLTKSLMERDIPVLCVVAGDNSNGLGTINTLNTISTLSNFAVKAGKALNIVYANNQAFNNTNVDAAIKDANKAFFNTISTLALFLSGGNTQLDNRDMLNLLDGSNYTVIDVKPGLYSLMVASSELKIPQGTRPVIARTLTVEGVSPDINQRFLHHKDGKVTNENAISIYADQFPLHIATVANFFKIEEETLRSDIDSLYNEMDESTVADVANAGRSVVDDDGMVF